MSISVFAINSILISPSFVTSNSTVVIVIIVIFIIFDVVIQVIIHIQVTERMSWWSSV